VEIVGGACVFAAELFRGCEGGGLPELDIVNCRK